MDIRGREGISSGEASRRRDIRRSLFPAHEYVSGPVCVPVLQCVSVQCSNMCVSVCASVPVWGHALLKLSAASPPSEARIDHGSMMMMRKREKSMMMMRRRKRRER